MPRTRVVAVATVVLFGAVLLIGSAGLVVSASVGSAGVGSAGVGSAGVGGPETVVWFVVAVLVSVPSIVLGYVVSRRRPGNPVGPLLGAIGLTFATVASTDTYAAAAAGSPGRLPVWDWLIAVSAGGWVWLYVPIGLLLLVFPDGRLAGARWRVVAIGLPGVAGAYSLLCTVSPEPYPSPFAATPHVFGTWPAWSTYLSVGLLPVFLGLLVASAVSLRVRHRRATPAVRAQVSWLAVAGLALPLTLLLCWASYLLLDGPDLVVAGLVVCYLAVPAATGIAMLRRDLYDVDRVLSTAVTYTLTSATLLTVFTGASVAGGIVLGRDSSVVGAAVTAICAVALAPLRRRLQRRIDRRLYPLRQGTLTALAELLARVHAGAARPEEVEQVLRDSLRDPELRVGYRVPGQLGVVDAEGNDLAVDPDAATEVRLGRTEIGVLIPGRPLPAALLTEVTAAAALLVEVVRLRLELGRALQDIAASRTRLLHAGYAERRRLEQDLHDGAQQRLVALGMSLRLAQRHLDDGSVDLAGLLDAGVAEIATSVAELRQIAHGLRPSSLDDGLGPALAGLGKLAGTTPLTLDLDPRLATGSLPDDVSVTAYYIASEAVANAVKHARADRIDLAVTRSDDSVRIRVSDDGRGGAVIRPGSGLAGLGDRAAALGGSLMLTSVNGVNGTVLEAVLPCGS